MKQLEQIDEISDLTSMMDELNSYTAPTMANYEADIDKVVELIDLKEELRAKQYSHSEESLQHLPEYHARLRYLGEISRKLFQAFETLELCEG